MADKRNKIDRKIVDTNYVDKPRSGRTLPAGRTIDRDTPTPAPTDGGGLKLNIGLNSKLESDTRTELNIGFIRFLYSKRFPNIHLWSDEDLYNVLREYSPEERKGYIFAGRIPLPSNRARDFNEDNCYLGGNVSWTDSANYVHKGSGKGRFPFGALVKYPATEGYCCDAIIAADPTLSCKTLTEEYGYNCHGNQCDDYGCPQLLQTPEGFVINGGCTWGGYNRIGWQDTGDSSCCPGCDDGACPNQNDMSSDPVKILYTNDASGAAKYLEDVFPGPSGTPDNWCRVIAECPDPNVLAGFDNEFECGYAGGTWVDDQCACIDDLAGFNVMNLCIDYANAAKEHMKGNCSQYCETGTCYYPSMGYDCDGTCTGNVDCAGTCNGQAIQWNNDTNSCHQCCGGLTGVECCDLTVANGCKFGQPTAVSDDGTLMPGTDYIDCCACGDLISGGNCAILDECGVCGGPGIVAPFCDCDGNVPDCAGVCGGSSVMPSDECPCDPVAHADLFDECGICEGDGASAACLNHWLDNDDPNKLVQSQYYLEPSVASADPIGSIGYCCNCNGNIYDCKGVCGGTSKVDFCGICGGDNICHLQIHELNQQDINLRRCPPTGIWTSESPDDNKNHSGSDFDCAGQCFGMDIMVDCGNYKECGGCEGGCPTELPEDCDGVCGGDAYYESCSGVPCIHPAVDWCGVECGDGTSCCEEHMWGDEWYSKGFIYNNVEDCCGTPYDYRNGSLQCGDTGYDVEQCAAIRGCVDPWPYQGPWVGGSAGCRDPFGQGCDPFFEEFNVDYYPGTSGWFHMGCYTDAVEGQCQGLQEGDEECTLGDFPGAGTFRCGGTLVGQQWVLTAAHCCYGMMNPYDPGGGMGSETGMFNQAVIGMHSTGWAYLPTYGDESSYDTYGFAKGQETLGIDGIIIHPYYLPGHELYDFCLVHLSEPAPRRFKPIRLNSNPALVETDGNPLVAVGSGVTVPGIGQDLVTMIVNETICQDSYWYHWVNQHNIETTDMVADTVQETTIPTITNCGDWSTYNNWVPSVSKFCAGGCYDGCEEWIDYGMSACQNVCDGDSGGPNIMWVRTGTEQPCEAPDPYKDPNCEAILVGVTGMIPYYCTCAQDEFGVYQSNLPGIFANVAEVSGWVQEQMRNPEWTDVDQCFDCNYWIEDLVNYIMIELNSWGTWPTDTWELFMRLTCELGWNSPMQDFDEGNYCNWISDETLGEFDCTSFPEECPESGVINIGGQCQCPTECCNTVQLERLGYNNPNLLDWMYDIALGSGWTYTNNDLGVNTVPDDRLIGGEEVSPQCGMGGGINGEGEDGYSTCRHPYYVLLGIGYPVPEPSPGTPCAIQGLLQCNPIWGQTTMEEQCVEDYCDCPNAGYTHHCECINWYTCQPEDCELLVPNELMHLCPTCAPNADSCGIDDDPPPPGPLDPKALAPEVG